MKILKETKLEEKIPKELADLYINKSRDRRKHTDSFGNVPVDYENSTYEIISPEQACKLWKNSADTRVNILVIIHDRWDDKHCIRWTPNGKLISHNTFDVKVPYTNRNGKTIADIRYLTYHYIFSIADKIYYKHEVNISDDKLQKNKNYRTFRQNLNTHRFWPFNNDGRHGQVEIPSQKYARFNHNYNRDIDLGKVTDKEDDFWFIPDTGNHSGDDDRSIYYNNKDTKETRKSLKNKKDFLIQNNNIINNFANDKMNDRRKSYFQYVTAINSGSELKNELQRKHRDLRDQRIYSRDLSQIIQLQANKLRLLRLRDILDDTNAEIKRQENKLDDLNKTTESDSYLQDKARLSDCEYQLHRYQQLVADYTKKIDELKNRLSEEGINELISNQKAKIADLTSETDNVQKIIQGIIYKNNKE